MRFFELVTAIGGLAYFAFFLIYLANQHVHPFAQPQPLRLAMVVSLLSAWALARFNRPLFILHYELICVSVVTIGVVGTAVIGNLVPSSESPYSRYWAIYSSGVFISWVIFGFMRLPNLSKRYSWRS